MKNAIILQGAGETTESFWLPWLAKNLTNRGYRIWLPQLPENDNPDINKTLPFILKNGYFNEETVLVGHSAGCPLILSVLENIKINIFKVVLVAGLIEASTHIKKIDDWQRKFLQKTYNWEKIKKHCKEFVFINSLNDPWGCNDKQGRKMLDKLGGLLILNKEGHMGSKKYNQPYKEFPLLLKLID